MTGIRKILTVSALMIIAVLPWKPASAQIDFVENKGQWNDKIQYKADMSAGAFFLEENSFSVLMHNPEEMQLMHDLEHGHPNKKTDPSAKYTLHSFFYRVNFLGATKGLKPVPEKPLATYNNYFLGSDRSKWKGNCRIFQAVTYKNLYPNIDLRYYNDGDNMKYDLIVHPGGNISQIALRYDGPTELLVRNKELIIKTPLGEVKELYPYSYQSSAKEGRKEVDCRYVVRNNVVTFSVKNYDASETLIIDPAIIFSSLTGSRANNWGYTATPGPDGSLFAGGISFEPNYPVSPGAYQTTFGGGASEDGLGQHDIAIFKFSANGSARLYATYLGGFGNEQPHSMVVDGAGNLVIAGRSSSTNYPVTRPVIGSGGFNDIVITKFNAAGTSLLGSVRIGGSSDDGVNIRAKYKSPFGTDRLRRNYGDDARSEVIFDAAGNIILASCTQSANFPVKDPSNSAQASFGGGLQDGVVLKFNSNFSNYLYGTFFGGSGDDACFVASISPNTNTIFIAGGTTSNNLPGNKTGVIYSGYRGGNTDGFITQLKPDSLGIIKTSYLGTSAADIVYGLKFDKAGFPYVMGTTEGSWPILNAAFSNPGSSQFISKLAPDFSRFIYSTVFGTGSSVPNISPIGFMVDRCENVYVSGWGGDVNGDYNNGSTQGLPEVSPLTNIPAADGSDFYFFVLKKDAASQLFGSHFGQFRGNIGDHVDGGTSRFDENGIIYQAVCANCSGGTTFPTTPGVWSSVNGSRGCNEAALKIEMNFSGVAATVRASINSVINDTSGCVPFRVDFIDTLGKGKKYYWDFGNGLRDTTVAPNFSTFTNYTAVGTYTVRVIAEDSTTCNIRDTVFIKIKAGDNFANLGFRAVKDPPCTSLNYTFVNESVPTRGSFGPQSFVWDFGDGSAPQVAFNGTHTFPAIGDYDVTLTLVDTLFCNAPDKITITIRVNPVVEAKFNTSPVGCAPYSAQFTNLSGTSDVTWEFSDGTTSTVENPVKLYSVPGTYQVRLIARDPNTCNKIDTSDYFTIVVSPKPDARFSWGPIPPQRNTPTQFNNLSTGAIRYLWNFGDGESSTEVNPRHQYNATGNYTAELIAYNAQNCTDTFSLVVNVLIDPLLDVPNAFTPGRFGVNGMVFVTGFGIAKMDWKIYNRWGQLVFQSTNRKQGWDGTFKGKLQAMDVYAYTLDAEFSDGKKLRKTGDITLLR